MAGTDAGALSLLRLATEHADACASAARGRLAEPAAEPNENDGRRYRMTTGLDGYTATAAADGARSLIHALHRLLGESAALRDIEDDLEGADADTRHSVHVFIETRAAWRTAAGLVGEIDQALRDAGLDLNDAARLSDAPSPYGRARQLVRETRGGSHAAGRGRTRARGTRNRCREHRVAIRGKPPTGTRSTVEPVRASHRA